MMDMTKLTILVLVIILPVCVCLDCLISFMTYNSGSVDWERYPTTISSYYTPLADKGVNPLIQSIWYFEVKACADISILLTMNSDLTGVLFEIFIGSWGNSKISVRPIPTSKQLYDTGPILNCADFSKFWLSWTTDGAVSLGSGDTKGVNTYFTTSIPSTPVGGLGVQSAFGSDAEWKYGKPSSLRVPVTCPVQLTTQLTETTPSTSDDCNLTPAVQRTEKTRGFFKRETDVYLSSLNQIGSTVQCALLRCVSFCLRNSGCWFFRFDTSGTGCRSCVIYDSSLSLCNETGPVDQQLYKLIDN